MKLERIVSAIIVLAVLFPMTACAMNWVPVVMLVPPVDGDELPRNLCCKWIMIFCCLLPIGSDDVTYEEGPTIADWGEVPAVYR